MTPMQTKFYSEAIILLMSFIPLSLGVLENKENFTRKNIGIIACVAFFSYLWGLMNFYAYGMIAGNVVNILSIGTIILSSVFAFVFLKDKMKKKDAMIIGVSVMMLLGFMFSL